MCIELNSRSTRIELKLNSTEHATELATFRFHTEVDLNWNTNPNTAKQHLLGNRIGETTENRQTRKWALFKPEPNKHFTKTQSGTLTHNVEVNLKYIEVQLDLQREMQVRRAM